MPHPLLQHLISGAWHHGACTCRRVRQEERLVPPFQPTLIVMFLSSVSSKTACSLRLISRDSSSVMLGSTTRDWNTEAMMPPWRDRLAWGGKRCQEVTGGEGGESGR